MQIKRVPFAPVHYAEKSKLVPEDPCLQVLLQVLHEKINVPDLQPFAVSVSCVQHRPLLPLLKNISKHTGMVMDSSNHEGHLKLKTETTGPKETTGGWNASRTSG